MAFELAASNSPRLFSFPCGQKKTGGEKENSLRLADSSGGLKNRNTMIYTPVFYIRWALRPVVLVRLSVNLTRGNKTLLYGRMISAPTAGSDVFTIIAEEGHPLIPSSVRWSDYAVILRSRRRRRIPNRAFFCGRMMIVLRTTRFPGGNHVPPGVPLLFRTRYFPNWFA